VANVTEGSYGAAAPDAILRLDLSALADLVAARVTTALEVCNAQAASPWMNIEATAAYLACSPERVRKMVQRRTIPFHQERPGARVFLNRKEIDQWMLNV
jgi:excisionase family DNA binding protein